MTMRDRILAVVRGTGPDRVPFVQYDGCAAPTEEIWAELGRENLGVLRWVGVCSTHAPNCRFDAEEADEGGQRVRRCTLHTPGGSLVEERLLQRDLGVWAAYRAFVREPRDYEVLLAYLRDLQVTLTPEAAAEVADALGDYGLPHTALERTPFQQLWIQWASLEDLCLHLVDCPDIVHECMAAMEATIRKGFEGVLRARPPYVVFPDNITAPAIGERYFRRYCLPLYRDLADALAEEDIPVFVHIDGDMKPLWAAIGESGIRGIDSLSPPPDNDTSVADAIEQWPEMALFVNFPSSVHLATPEGVYAQTVQLLEEGASSGRLQIQVSENVPPGVWRTSYPAIVSAIRDFHA